VEGDVTVLEDDIFAAGFVKLTVSPGRDKERKLVSIVRRLTGAGLVIAPDAEYVLHIVETLDNALIRSVSLHADASVDMSRESLQQLNDQSAPVVVTDQPGLDSLPGICFRYVVNWSLPSSPHEYEHLLNRFLDNRRESFAVLLFEPEDRYLQEEMLRKKYCTDTESLRAHFEVLDRMEEYVFTDKCRLGYLAGATGRSLEPDRCGRCDNCRKADAARAMGVLDVDKARVLLYSAAETREKFGVHVLTDIVRGNESGRIREYRLDRASTFGKLGKIRRRDIQTLFGDLIRLGYLRRTGGTFPSLCLTALGRKLLGTVKVNVLELPKKMDVEPGDYLDAALLEAVRNFRREQAQHLNIPAFTVFSDSVMKRIVQQAPLTKKDLMSVKGFGPVTWEICGEALLGIVRSYEAGIQT